MYHHLLPRVLGFSILKPDFEREKKSSLFQLFFQFRRCSGTVYLFILRYQSEGLCRTNIEDLRKLYFQFSGKTLGHGSSPAHPDCLSLGESQGPVELLLEKESQPGARPGCRWARSATLPLYEVRNPHAI